MYLFNSKDGNSLLDFLPSFIKFDCPTSAQSAVGESIPYDIVCHTVGTLRWLGKWILRDHNREVDVLEVYSLKSG